MTDKFRVEVKVYEVKITTKYPNGIKAKFVLIDMERCVARLLVDNHAPYGFHIHSKLPKDKTARTTLQVDNFFDAFDEFLKEAERIVEYEN